MDKMETPFIALLTDFGDADFFVASLKGVLASINPSARMIDITHNIPSFDVLAGAFVLFASYGFFPKDTIFLTVVDPGVGSSRRILYVETENYRFIAPDNGVLSLVLENETGCITREITNPKCFLSQIGVTFEGRDKMAPAAAWLSLGFPPEDVGASLKTVQTFELDKPRKKTDGLAGSILYRDKFGNLITNIPSFWLDLGENKHEKTAWVLNVGDVRIFFAEFYSSIPQGKSALIRGSLGLLEIAVREGSASSLLGLEPGDAVKITKINVGD